MSEEPVVDVREAWSTKLSFSLLSPPSAPYFTLRQLVWKKPMSEELVWKWMDPRCRCTWSMCGWAWVHPPTSPPAPTWSEPWSPGRTTRETKNLFFRHLISYPPTSPPEPWCPGRTIWQTNFFFFNGSFSFYILKNAHCTKHRRMVKVKGTKVFNTLLCT
jgi:hypothetical protein